MKNEKQPVSEWKLALFLLALISILFFAVIQFISALCEAISNFI
jgi:hypothetical protein